MKLIPKEIMSPQTASSSYSGEAQWGPPEPAAVRGEEIAEGYEVVALIRRGRRLDVYDAWSESRGCRCVIKTLRPERAGDVDAASHLTLEGTLLESLSHPHLVRAYETLTTERSRPAVVLETLPGHTLSYLIETQGRLPFVDIALLGIQLSSVLTYLHGHNWVHLDVKPSNVVATGGRAILIDLSLIRRPGDTDVGGTFDYLSPEQATGASVTAAADVWGLGVTMFEATTGDVPFSEASHKQRTENGDLVYPQLAGPPPPIKSLRRSIPKRLAGIIDACLQPVPTQRPTLDEVAGELAEWAGVDPKITGSPAF